MTDWVCGDCGFTGDQSDACRHADHCPGNAVEVLRGEVGSLATRLAIAHWVLRALIDVVDDNENYVDDRYARAEVRAAVNAAQAYLDAMPKTHPPCRARTSGETHCADCMRSGNRCCLCGTSVPQDRP